MADRMPIVGGNWKMNTIEASAIALARAVAEHAGTVAQACDLVVYPPLTALRMVGTAITGSGIQLGAQNVYPATSGAFTGEVGIEMLQDLDVAVVLIGHSERRHVIGEADRFINEKVHAVLEAGLGVTLCVGETLAQRDAGDTETITLAQLRAGLAGVAATAMDRVVIAYEPVWAIGTGRTASPDDAVAVHQAIRADLGKQFSPAVAEATRIQYGGSVKPENAADLFSKKDIDGGLIGGASLNAEAFAAIVDAAVATACTAADSSA